MVEVKRMPAASGRMDLARWRLSPGEGWAPHRHHQFHEALWIEHGSVEHTLDGQTEVLRAGHIAWVRLGSIHSGVVRDRAGVIFVNLSVRIADVQALRRRLGAEQFPLWLPQRELRQQLPADSLAGLSRMLASLDPANAADRDLLLLHLAHVMRAPLEADTDALPAGLRQALAQVVSESAWGEGVSGLARRAGLSREHASRSIRASLGCTPSELLHTMRMHRIARALVYDDRPVAELASEFGFRGLGHFYRGFQAAFSETPAAWRRKRRTGLGFGPAPQSLC